LTFLIQNVKIEVNTIIEKDTIKLSKKVTTFDIAESLGLSRNTVSKALNNHPSIPEETRRRVIEQAAAMGYKKVPPLPSLSADAKAESRESIAYVTRSHLHISSFWMNVLHGVEQVASKQGFELKVGFISDEQIAGLELPALLDTEIRGVIVGGALNRHYTEAILGKHIPKVLIDICPDTELSGLEADVVSMENEDCVYRITRQLLRSGCGEIGFIGDIASSRSFMERWLGFQRAVAEFGGTVDRACSLIDESPDSYQTYEDVARAMSTLSRLPQAFVCANDRIALSAIRYLRSIGKRVPGDIAISGFDGIGEADFLDFSLTTVAHDEFHLGARAAEQLIARLRHPAKPYETVRLASRLVWGDSTRRSGEDRPE